MQNILLLLEQTRSRKVAADEYTIHKLRERYHLTDTLARTIAELANVGNVEREASR